MEDMIILTDNGKKILRYMQKNDKVFLGKDLAEILDIKGSGQSFSALIRRGLLDKDEPVIKTVEDRNGVLRTREYTTYVLTDMGRNFEINQ